jgi:hypothetical protein
MIDQEFEHFDVRAITRHELARQLSFARNMLLASAAASMAILGAGAYFISLML